MLTLPYRPAQLGAISISIESTNSLHHSIEYSHTEHARDARVASASSLSIQDSSCFVQPTALQANWTLKSIRSQQSNRDTDKLIVQIPILEAATVVVVAPAVVFFALEMVFGCWKKTTASLAALTTHRTSPFPTLAFDHVTLHTLQLTARCSTAYHTWIMEPAT